MSQRAPLLSPSLQSSEVDNSLKSAEAQRAKSVLENRNIIRAGFDAIKSVYCGGYIVKLSPQSRKRIKYARRKINRAVAASMLEFNSR